MHMHNGGGAADEAAASFEASTNTMVHPSDQYFYSFVELAASLQSDSPDRSRWQHDVERTVSSYSLPWI